MMSDEQIEQYAQRAKEKFAQGYNCAQAVLAVLADLYGVEEDLALRLAASFGGGVGRMRMTCGAASAMFILEGLQSGSTVAGDSAAKLNNYAQVQQLASSFKNSFGSLVCAELLSSSLQPKQPCKEMVAGAVRIFLKKNGEKFA